MNALSPPALYQYVRHLPPKLVIGKVRQTITTRLALPRASRSYPPADYDWESAFARPDLESFAKVYRVYGDRFQADCHKLHSGEFVSNGVSHSFGSPGKVRWDDSVLPGPRFGRWHHDLAFFFFAIPLIADDPDRGIPTAASMVRSLDAQLAADSTQLRRFQWSPIAIASRILGLTTGLSLAHPALANHRTDVATIGAHIWRATEMLKLTVERYLGFNHAATTEASLLLGLLLRHDAEGARKSLSELVRTFEHSVLSDGMWAERSSSYHLNMLILVDALRALCDSTTPEHARFLDVHQRMRTALAALVHPDGEIALFNDAAIAEAPAPSTIGFSPEEAPSTIVLANGGYARISQAGTVVIMDAGPMGPDAVIGHGHADFLSIEVSVGKKRLIVDPGVASTSPGKGRYWTRSAASHNGPTLTDCEPAEFFGTWRVGRRGTAWFKKAEAIPPGALAIAGECNGYTPWGVTVTRNVVIEESGHLSIMDRWLGKVVVGASTSFLVPDPWTVERVSPSELRITHPDGSAVRLATSGGEVCRIDSSSTFPTGPMLKVAAKRIVIQPHNASVTTVIEVCARGLSPTRP